MISQYLEIAPLEDFTPSGQKYLCPSPLSFTKSFLYEESNNSLFIVTPSKGINEELR